MNKLIVTQLAFDNLSFTKTNPKLSRWGGLPGWQASWLAGWSPAPDCQCQLTWQGIQFVGNALVHGLCQSHQKSFSPPRACLPQPSAPIPHSFLQVVYYIYICTQQKPFSSPRACLPEPLCKVGQQLLATPCRDAAPRHGNSTPQQHC